MSDCNDQESKDSQLMKRICQRDESALGEAIGLYGPQVQALCVRICFDPLDADGVVSQVFWELWNSADKYDASRGSLRAFLLTLARSRAIDRQRSNASAARVRAKEFTVFSIAKETCGVYDEPIERQIMKEQEQEIRQALKRLTPSQRSALEMAFFDGLSHREVADKLELPLGTVKTNIRRGLLQLRALLTETSLKGRVV